MAWRGWVSAVLMLLFVAAWYAMGARAQLTFGRSGFYADVWLWALFFCPAWALLLPGRRARLWWAAAGAAGFWVAEAARGALATGPAGCAVFWPAGWAAVAFAVTAGAFIYLLGGMTARLVLR